MGNHSSLLDSLSAAKDGDFILTMNEGDKFIHANSFKQVVGQIVEETFTGETKPLGTWFCSFLNELVDEFQPAPVRLIEQGKTGE